MLKVYALATMQSLKEAKLDAEDPFLHHIPSIRFLSVQFCFLQALHDGTAVNNSCDPMQNLHSLPESFIP